MLYSKNDFLMGTDICITVISDTNAMEDIYNVFGIFYGLEKEFSRFKNDSDLSLLNTQKERELSNRFIHIFQKTKEVYQEVDMFFNPLVNIGNIGYSSDFGKGIFEKNEMKQDLNMNMISVIGNFITLTENQNLDFGGIVKGYGVDLATKFLKEKGYNNFIINAGGDIYIQGRNVSGNIPVVAIDNPLNAQEIFATFEITNQAISTSGTYKRKWNIEKENFHHILTPETNRNNNEIISITLIADECYICDSYATACIAMGIEKSLSFLKKRNIDGVIIGSDGNVYQTKGMEKYHLNIIG